jgi:hypothetical protein
MASAELRWRLGGYMLRGACGGSMFASLIPLSDKDLLFIFTVLRIRDVYPGSRILISTHPGSQIPDLGSRIPDPKTSMKDRSGKKFVVIPFFGAINVTKFN